MPYENPLRAIWRSGRASLGSWVCTPEPLVAEMLAACGFDEVLVDQQHGSIDANDLAPLFLAISGRGAIPITRVPSNDAAAIGKSLDLGAQAVVVPMVNSAEEAARAVAACRYATRGSRSIGSIRAHLIVGSEDVEALESPVCAVMVETASGLANVDAIAGVDGLDAIYIGPADLSLSLGMPFDRSLRTPEQAARHAEAIETIRRACDRHGIVAGINCSNGQIARGYVEQGFRMVTVTADIDVIPSGGQRELARARGEEA